MTMTDSTSDKTVRKYYKDQQEKLGYLYDRWQDEKQYEDFGDYAKFMERSFDGYPGLKFVKATKRPFGVQFMSNGRVYRKEATCLDDY